MEKLNEDKKAYLELVELFAQYQETIPIDFKDRPRIQQLGSTKIICHYHLWCIKNGIKDTIFNKRPAIKKR